MLQDTLEEKEISSHTPPALGRVYESRLVTRRLAMDTFVSLEKIDESIKYQKRNKYVQMIQ